MTYQNIKKGYFLSRPNRFIAQVEIDGKEETVHVKNTGRCQELLTPHATVYLEHCPSPKRKTQYDLIAVEKGSLLINMDSQAPNKVFQEWANQGNFKENLTHLKAEQTYGNSRFDFYWETPKEKGYTELKGVTLETDGIACFPDAPTLRGIKHIQELIHLKSMGFSASICFLIQMEGMKELRPNDVTHPDFGNALREAEKNQVEIFALSCKVQPDSLIADQFIPINLRQ